MASKMRYGCSVAVLWAIACVAASEPGHAAGTDLEVSLGQPKMTFAGALPELTRTMLVSADSALLRAQVSSHYCEELPVSYTGSTVPAACNSATFASNSRSEAAQSATLTLKLPRLQARAPYLELSLRSWRAGSLLQGTTRGTELDAELTQPFGRVELTAGMSRPIGNAAFAQWQSTWLGVAVRLAARAQMRWLAETSREASSGARDTRHSIMARRAIADNVYANFYVTRAFDDPIHPWTAGTAIAWTF